MARMYYRRSILGWVMGFLVALILVALAAHLVYAWLVVWLPLIGSALLFVFFMWFGFARRR